MTSSSDGRPLEDLPAADGPPAAPMLPGMLVPPRDPQHLLVAPHKDASHDALVSSTSNLSASGGPQGQDTDVASVLLYQSCNSGKDPRLWNVQEVSGFMVSIGCSNYADAFTKEVRAPYMLACFR